MNFAITFFRDFKLRLQSRYFAENVVKCELSYFMLNF